ncbi:hypothetical protein [Pectinatus haikarae]|uniref:Uncharacterized protein n=1 Tax=Pectinatus haikarae TaxID=349096 RepID=A0ABT9Y3V8_9FIRM|nr:hypothetical protein [Pectinatus haikarae]MDQ0202508.1 hypothetical protein [Pectinatus haikarae]
MITKTAAKTKKIMSRRIVGWVDVLFIICMLIAAVIMMGVSR